MEESTANWPFLSNHGELNEGKRSLGIRHLFPAKFNNPLMFFLWPLDHRSLFRDAVISSKSPAIAKKHFRKFSEVWLVVGSILLGAIVGMMAHLGDRNFKDRTLPHQLCAVFLDNAFCSLFCCLVLNAVIYINLSACSNANFVALYTTVKYVFQLAELTLVFGIYTLMLGSFCLYTALFTSLQYLYSPILFFDGIWYVALRSLFQFSMIGASVYCINTMSAVNLYGGLMLEKSVFELGAIGNDLEEGFRRNRESTSGHEMSTEARTQVIMRCLAAPNDQDTGTYLRWCREKSEILLGSNEHMPRSLLRSHGPFLESSRTFGQNRRVTNWRESYASTYD
eukprot:CAMPEP_0196589634 /NCGR_PEP_ID=MMETSP1081-20130531/64129_1 /TAXON_ID=36882 /ORGANISM="Pyramimonas amylifera, Strain CCMP720" /LENGTH=337 /DNA_ID=CAMNT_0041912487 /DNA_START=123 /DNA_END=1136 /DNA_ORIENTATION=-